MINKPREEAGQFYTANKAGQPAPSLGKINPFISEKIIYFILLKSLQRSAISAQVFYHVCNLNYTAQLIYCEKR